jgi:peroxiredoxin
VVKRSLCLGLLTVACVRPPSLEEIPRGPLRLPILSAEYGGSVEHPAAMSPGDRLQTLELPLADGGSFDLADALVAGPVVLIWIGGAEHEALTRWISALDRSLAQLEQRSTTLAFVRPLEPDAALRWATELRLQTPVAGDPDDQLARLLDQDANPLELAVLIVIDGTIAYRKLGDRPPQLDELLAVIDGTAEQLRCCPAECEGPPCQ